MFFSQVSLIGWLCKIHGSYSLQEIQVFHIDLFKLVVVVEVTITCLNMLTFFCFRFSDKIWVHHACAFYMSYVTIVNMSTIFIGTKEQLNEHWKWKMKNEKPQTWSAFYLHPNNLGWKTTDLVCFMSLHQDNYSQGLTGRSVRDV